MAGSEYQQLADAIRKHFALNAEQWKRLTAQELKEAVKKECERMMGVGAQFSVEIDPSDPTAVVVTREVPMVEQLITFTIPKRENGGSSN